LEAAGRIMVRYTGFLSCISEKAVHYAGRVIRYAGQHEPPAAG
jgi:hypothetical protein